MEALSSSCFARAGALGGLESGLRTVAAAGMLASGCALTPACQAVVGAEVVLLTPEGERMGAVMSALGVSAVDWESFVSMKVQAMCCRRDWRRVAGGFDHFSCEVGVG